EIVENMSANQLGQAGISAAQLMAEKDVKAVIAKNIGPRASNALKQFNIAIYYGDGVVKNVLQEFIDGKLEKFQ
ncbi:diguanylate cyclase, partial [Patescibacteria group bacterium]|nr:diguanylate cyclase [Patescibacteria group bacterium]